MGNALLTLRGFVGSVSACMERQGHEINKLIESQRKQSVGVPPSTPRRPPAVETPRSRDDHVMLSARSIAVQKKAPLFREEDAGNEYLDQLTARRMEISQIKKLAQTTPRKN